MLQMLPTPFAALVWASAQFAGYNSNRVLQATIFNREGQDRSYLEQRKDVGVLVPKALHASLNNLARRGPEACTRYDMTQCVNVSAAMTCRDCTALL